VTLPAQMPSELTPQPAGRPSVVPIFDAALRVVGGLVAVAAALLTATLELLFATLRVGGHLIGVSAVLAVAANLALGWFAHRVIGRNWAVALPAVAWFGLMLLAGRPTTEGDILLAGDNWVGIVTMFAGSIAFAIVAFRLILAAGVDRARR
jgi:hypothetical protein